MAPKDPVIWQTKCAMVDDYGRHCIHGPTHKGLHEVDPADPGLVNGPPYLVRSYYGETTAWAVSNFQADAQFLSRFGYQPTSQSWAGTTGGPSVGDVVMWGAFAGSKSTSRGGTLTVVYQRGMAAPVVETVGGDTAPCPRCAEPIKKAAKMCRFCKLDLTTA